MLFCASAPRTLGKSLFESHFSFPALVPSAKAKAQPAKVSISSALVGDIIDLDEVKTDMTAVLAALQDDFTRSLSIRTTSGNPPFTS